MRFRVLGELEVSRDDRLIGVSSPIQRRLLACLISRAGERVSAEGLIEAVWDGAAPRSAAKTLQGHMVHLRQVLKEPASGGAVRTVPGGYQLVVDEGDIDALCFASQVRGAQTAATVGRWSAASLILDDALRLWRGPAYAEFAGLDFASGEISRLGELRGVAMEQRFAAALALGEDAALIPDLEQALASSPTRETLWEQLITALYRAGRQSDALGAFSRARRTLAEELGVDPGPRLQLLQRAVLAQDAELGHVARGGPIDLAEMVQAFEGRAEDLAWLSSQQAATVTAGARIAVVAGASGIGKTRLIEEFSTIAQRAGCVIIRPARAISPTLDEFAPGHLDRPIVTLIDEPLTGLDVTGLGGRPVLVVVALDPNRAPRHVVTTLQAARWRDLESLPEPAARRIAERYRRVFGPAWTDAELDDVVRASGGKPGELHNRLRALARERGANDVGSLAGIASGQTYASAGAGAGPSRLAAQCPYRGLDAYGVDDAALFFGRDAVIEQLVARVADRVLVAVVSPSGAGKSSLVRAGLLPALAGGCLPGSAAWSQHLLDGGDSLPEVGPGPGLVFVDQFEQTWATLPDDAIPEYLDELAGLADAGHRVVLTIRADQVERCAAHPRLRELVSEGLLLVAPLTVAEVTDLITGPAARAGRTVEPALVERIHADLEGVPTPLPLLSTALAECWRSSPGDSLTLAAYLASGGVAGSLGRQAETAFSGLGGDEQVAARRALLRLATDEGGALLRRRCSYGELAGDAATVRALDSLAAHRLVTVGAGGVEVSHEALFTHWPRLAGWLDDDAQGRRMRAHLTPAALAWEIAGRPDSDLYRDIRLVAALEWSAGREAESSPLEREFLHAAQQYAAREHTEQRQRAARDARSRRRLRMMLTASVAALTLAVAATLVAVAQRRVANERARVAVARQLGAAALIRQPLDHSLLLAASAVRLDDSPQTRSDLLAALESSPQTERVFNGDGDRLYALGVGNNDRTVVAGGTLGELLSWNARGSPTPSSVRVANWGIATIVARPHSDEVLVSGVDGGTRQGPALMRWDIGAHRRLGPDLPGARYALGSLAFTPDGRYLAGNEEIGGVLVWDFAHLDRPPTHLFSDSGLHLYRRIAYAVGGAFAVTTAAGAVRIIRLRDRALLRTFQVGSDVTAVASNPAGSLLAVGGQDGTTRLWSTTTGKQVRALATHTSAVIALAFSDDGRRIATGGGDGEVQVSDPSTGTLLDRLTGHVDRVTGVAFSHDGTSVSASSDDGQVLTWDLSGRQWLPQQLLPPGESSINGMATSPSGQIALVTGGSVRFLDDTTQHPDSGITVPVNRRGIIAAAFSPDGAVLATSEVGGGVHLLDARTHRVTARLATLPGDATDIAFSPDGRHLAVLRDDEPARVHDEAYIFDVSTRRLVGRPITVMPGPGIVAWSPGSQRIAVTSYFHTGLTVWNAFTGHAVWSQPATVGASTAAWSPDGSSLATGTDTGHIQLRRSSNGELEADWNAHTDAVVSLAYNPGGTILAAGAGDGTVSLFDVRSGTQLGPAVTQAVGAVLNENVTVAFDSAGRLITAAISLWVLDFDVNHLLARACAIADRNLTKAEWADLHTGQKYVAACP